ncbi:hypothetical protein FOBRF1_011977 [Fusarium oxysporum]
MKHLSTIALLSLLSGALAGRNDLASDCVLTKTLPTVTVGCSEHLPSATTVLSLPATQQPGHKSYPSGIAKPGVDQPDTQSLAAKPSQSTSPGSSGASDTKPTINGTSGSNSTDHAPGASDAPALVSGASGMISHVNVEMVMASLLACLMPILIDYL